MAQQATKRRPVARKKSKGSVLVELSPEPKKRREVKVVPHRWIGESLAVVSVSLGAFLTASLLSGWMLSNGRNLMGPVGQQLHATLSQSFGWGALLLSFVGVWLGFRFWGGETADGEDALKGKDAKKGAELLHPARGVQILGFVLLLVGCAAVGGIFGDLRGGGVVGSSIGIPIRTLFGKTGATLLGSAFLLMAYTLVSGKSVGMTLREVLENVFWITALCVVTVPVWTWRGLRWTGSRGANGLGGASGYLGSKLGVVFKRREREDDFEEEEEEKMPPPRLRKNRVPPVIELVEEVGVQNEPMRPVIVKRGAEQRDKKKEREEAAAARPPTQFKEYRAPDLSLLTPGDPPSQEQNDDELQEKSQVIVNKLRDFNIHGRITEVHPGPVITLFEFEPAAGVKVGRIAALQDDLAMSLRASSIRIIAPIPKRGTVGIEVPNKSCDIVRLRDILESTAFRNEQSILTVALGKDTYGEAVAVDIASMPHLLMAGATGTGKSVSINTLLLSLLYRASPEELGLILIDPKVLELSVYEGVPHLRVPVVTDPKQAKAVLSWAVKEMERRYRFMQQYGVRNIDGYNRIVSGEDKKPSADFDEEDEILDNDPNTTRVRIEPIAPEELKAMPKIVIVIDELADLMLTVGREIEELITRLAQKARAAGIHLILATQRPSVDVITGLIKANFPARLSFRVTSRIDSRTILDSMGAEKLLGRGDMLFMLPGAGPLRRIHGAFVSDAEVQRFVGTIKKLHQPRYDEQIMKMVEQALEEDKGGEGGVDGVEGAEEIDPLFDKAVEVVLQKGTASTSMIQRAFRIGYNRAARIVDQMEREGIVGPMDGVRGREIIRGESEPDI